MMDLKCLTQLNFQLENIEENTSQSQGKIIVECWIESDVWGAKSKELHSNSISKTNFLKYYKSYF